MGYKFQPNDLDMTKEYLLWSQEALGTLVNPEATFSSEHGKWCFIFNVDGTEHCVSIEDIKVKV